MSGDRLKEIRKSLKLTQAELGEKLNIPWSRIKDMESGKQKISSDFASAMEDNFSISGWWLLTGKESMPIRMKNDLPTICQCSVDDNTVNLVTLNYYPEIVAAAGYGGINDFSILVQQPLKLDRSFLEDILNIRKYNNIDVIRVVGDSMEPFIYDGEVVLIERINEAKNGETVIANINGHVYVKKFQTDPFGRWVKLISHNGSYNEIYLSEDQLEFFSIVGIVRAKIKAF